MKNLLYKFVDLTARFTDKFLEHLFVTVSALVLFVQPIKGLFLLVGLFLVLDTVYALYTYKKINKGWSWFKSHKFSAILTKGVKYAVAIFISHAIDVYILKDSLFFGIPPIGAKTATFVVLYIETKSIDEKRTLLGLKSFFIVAKEWVAKGKRIKEDVNDLSL